VLIPWGRTLKYEGKLVCPYGYGVVLSNITRAQLDKAFPLDAQELLLPPHLVICQDEMTDKAEAEPFQEKLILILAGCSINRQ